MTQAFSHTDVFGTWPHAAQRLAVTVRDMIREEAQALGVGPLTETLKWGEPAFLTEATGAGTTLRLAWKAKTPEVLQLLVHCGTTLVDDWRMTCPDLQFEGNRALWLSLDAPVPEGDLRRCLRSALTYHLKDPVS
jgi:hypothetical protein